MCFVSLKLKNRTGALSTLRRRGARMHACGTLCVGRDIHLGFLALYDCGPRCDCFVAAAADDDDESTQHRRRAHVIAAGMAGRQAGMAKSFDCAHRTQHTERTERAPQPRHTDGKRQWERRTFRTGHKSGICC